MKRSGLRLFPKLLISFFIFAVAIVLAFVLAFTIAILLTTGGTAGWSPYVTLDEKAEPSNLEIITGFDGWVEKINDQLEVVQVYGNKQTEATVYSYDELLRLTTPRQDHQAYTAFITEEPGSGAKYLALYSTNNVKSVAQIELSAQNTDTTVFTAFIGVFVLLFILICLAMSFYLVRQIRRPLNDLSQGMDRVKEGEAGVHLDFKAGGDFAEIRDTFNDMIARIETQEKEKRRAEEKKSRLLLELSHDIRTPVATVKSVAAALNEGLVPEGEIKNYYGIIDQKADRIATLSESMFDMLKVAEAPIQLQKTDLSEFVRNLCAYYYDEFEKASLTLVPEIPETTIWVAVDENLMHRAIGNLIGNALRYNTTGEEIRIKLEVRESAAVLSVIDDGRPVAEDLRPGLFDAFTRGDSARRTDGGTGLGLSIAKTVVEKHGGNLRYESQGDNRFIVSLPLKDA